MCCDRSLTALATAGLLIAIGVAGTPGSVHAGEGAVRPNILFIPVDDLKPLLGCYGVKHVKTPNLDRLAARGTVFVNNSCQQAVCGPSRASLMTGRYPDSTRVYDLKTRMRDMNPDILSLPQYLSANGYLTTGLGKTYDPRCVDKMLDEPSWSIPYGNKSHPLSYAADPGAPVSGYQNPETQKAAAQVKELIRDKRIRDRTEQKKLNKQFPRSRPSTECCDVPDDAYHDGALAKKGLELLDKYSKGKKPFFLSLGFHKPHLPFVAPKRYWDLYDRDAIELHPFRKHAQNGPEISYHNSGELRSGYTDIDATDPIPDEKQKELIHGYMACVSYVDAQIGMLLDKLDELGIADRTIICLWGDHGWHLGDHDMWCKHSNFEQAVRAPLIIAAPSQKAKGQHAEAPTAFVDIFPTLCELAGLPIPPEVQGKSLVPMLNDPRASVREAALGQYPRNMDGNSVMGYTLRNKRYRYVKWIMMDYYQGERSGPLVATELYDFQHDPYETVNQAENPDLKPVVDMFERIFREMNVAQHSGVYLRVVSDDLGPVQLNGKGQYCSCATTAVNGPAFDVAHEMTVSECPSRASQAAYKRPVLIPIEPGVSYTVTFYCKSAAAGTVAEFTAILQSRKRYRKIVAGSVKVGNDWQKVTVSGTSDVAYAAGETVITCHMGNKKQKLLIGGMTIEK